MLNDVVPLSAFHAGFLDARTRYDRAAESREPLTVFLPLFEALNWAVVLDDRLRAHWRRAPTNADPWWSDGFERGDTVRGMRFARQRIHHQWAEALWLSEGASGPVGSRSVPQHEWRWRPDLPPGRDNKFESEYDANLAAVPARVTLHELAGCFGLAFEHLAPT